VDIKGVKIDIPALFQRHLPEYGPSDCGFSYTEMCKHIYGCVMREHCTFDSFLDVAKFTNLTPLSLLISCRLSFPIVGLKMSSLLTLVLKSPNRIFT
jgi:hypothetical protein